MNMYKMSRQAPLSLYKPLLLWFGCLVWRLMPFRPPNIEPVFAGIMPVGKYYGPVSAFVFGALSIIFVDIIQGMVGGWTWVSAVTYGLVGLGAWYYLHSRQGVVHYAVFAVLGTLFFDGVTGVLAGPIFLSQSLTEAFTGQIPFTINHLVGNLFLSVTLSPLLARWFSMRPSFVLFSSAGRTL